jgi:hypothetical protein
MITEMKDVVKNIVSEATRPVMILLVAQGCKTEKTTAQISLEEKIINLPISFYTLCVSDNELEFPQLLTPSIYYFIPQNTTPAFWRQGIVLDVVENDIEIINKVMNGTSYEEARFSDSERLQIKEVDSILETEKTSLHTFPSAFQQARNLAKEVWKTGKRAARGLPVLVPTEVGFQRLLTCEGCDRFDKDTSRCAECGCFMKTKSQLASASCPLNKWQQYV